MRPDMVQVASRPAASGIFSTPIDLTAPSRDSFSPEVAMDAAGDAFAVWRRGRFGQPAAVQATVRPSGGNFSAPIVLSAHDDPFDPHVAVDAAGDAIALWTSFHGLHGASATAAGYLAPGSQLRPATPMSRR